MLPVAPGRLSMITLWPRVAVMCCPTWRAMMSLPVPDPNGTTMEMARLGKSWAPAVPGSIDRPAAAPTPMTAALLPMTNLETCTRSSRIRFADALVFDGVQLNRSAGEAKSEMPVRLEMSGRFLVALGPHFFERRARLAGGEPGFHFGRFVEQLGGRLGVAHDFRDVDV